MLPASASRIALPAVAELRICGFFVEPYICGAALLSA